MVRNRVAKHVRCRTVPRKNALDPLDTKPSLRSRGGSAEMMRQFALAILSAGSVFLACGAWATELRPAVDRPELLEVGDPILITRKTLAMEMRRNVELRDWVRLYGAPDYSEVQEIQIDPPWAPYEVRLYYLKRDAYLAFGRVNVAPNVYDFGVRKYVGGINPAVLDRLLTARPATYSPPPSSGPQPIAPAAVIIETHAVEGVQVRN